MGKGERVNGRKGAGAYARLAISLSLFLPLALSLLLAGCDTLRVQRPLRPAPPPGPAEAGAVAPPLEQVWRYSAEGAFGPAPALVADGRVLVATRHGEVHLVDAASGDRIGKAGVGEAVEGTPVLLDGRLLVLPVAKGKYGLVAYDLVEGRRVWTRRGDPHVAGLLLAGDVLLAAAYDGTVRGLDPRTGTERWSLRPDTLARYFAAPVLLASGRAAVADDRGRVTALDPATGRVAWTADVGAPVHETPGAAGGLLIVPTTRGRLVALDAATGAEVWRHEAEDTGVLFASPTVAPGSGPGQAVLVGASDGVVRRLDAATGAVVWTRRFDGNVAAAPLVVGETVYVGTLDRRLVALDLATGAERWSTELEGRIKSASVVIGDVVLVFAEPHHVHAFRAVGAPGAGVASR
jgi:outer membrane protein assembly factor BamB